jgi:hypothetical protein
MGTKGKDLIMAGACLFFVLLSLAGVAAVFISGELTGVDGLMMLMVCGGMFLLFAWLTFSALQAAGLFVHAAESSQPAAAPAPSPAAPEAAASSRPAQGK